MAGEYGAAGSGAFACTTRGVQFRPGVLHNACANPETLAKHRRIEIIPLLPQLVEVRSVAHSKKSSLLSVAFYLVI